MENIACAFLEPKRVITLTMNQARKLSLYLVSPPSDPGENVVALSELLSFLFGSEEKQEG